jgi:hypothetical protein
MLGLKNVKKTEKKLSFDDDEKRIIIEDFLQNGGSKQEIGRASCRERVSVRV